MNRQHYYKARRRVQKLKAFYINFICWTVVSALLLFIYAESHGGFFWPIFPIAGWGLGVLFQAFDIFGFGRGWEQRKILEEMQRIEDEEATRRWLEDREKSQHPTPPALDLEDELKLKEFKKLRKEWDDQEFV